MHALIKAMGGKLLVSLKSILWQLPSRVTENSIKYKRGTQRNKRKQCSLRAGVRGLMEGGRER